ncbi:MAG: Na+/H+ antiporter NhaC family protein, partial [Rikenellaceae bacterium]
ENIDDLYCISIWFLLIPIAVITMIVKGVPAVPVLMIGSLLGVASAAIFQGNLLLLLNGGEALSAREYYDILSRMMYGSISPQSGVDTIDNLLSTRGMAGMLDTIWLIIASMIFAGVMEAGHFLERITGAILHRVSSRPAMVAATSASCIISNLTTSDQYISIIVPGKMFNWAYRSRGYSDTLLSRTLEDSATATSPLIPWNTCGATQAAVLGVATLSYLPFAFFCWLSPLMTLLLAFTGVAQVDKSSEANC